MDYINLVRDIIEPLVNNPKELQISIQQQEDNHKVISVTSNNNDIARLIGKGGSVAEAIREVVNVAAKLNKERVHIKFFSNTK